MINVVIAKVYHRESDPSDVQVFLGSTQYAATQDLMEYAKQVLSDTLNDDEITTFDPDELTPENVTGQLQSIGVEVEFSNAAVREFFHAV